MPNVVKSDGSTHYILRVSTGFDISDVTAQDASATLVEHDATRNLAVVASTKEDFLNMCENGLVKTVVNCTPDVYLEESPEMKQIRVDAAAKAAAYQE